MLSVICLGFAFLSNTQGQDHRIRTALSAREACGVYNDNNDKRVMFATRYELCNLHLD